MDKKTYSLFHKKGTFSVHSFIDDYLPIPERPGSQEYLFHEIPGISVAEHGTAAVSSSQTQIVSNVSAAPEPRAPDKTKAMVDLPVVEEDILALGEEAWAELGQSRAPTRLAVRQLGRIPKKTGEKIKVKIHYE